MNTARLFVVSTMLFVFAGQAHAEFVVKRYPCKELPYNGTTINTFYNNETGVTKHIHVHITRNGCRPKDLTYSLGITQSGFSWIWRGHMTGKFPNGLGFDLPDGYAAVFFIDVPPGAVNARGTMDFVYSVE